MLKLNYTFGCEAKLSIGVFVQCYVRYSVFLCWSIAFPLLLFGCLISFGFSGS